MSSAVATRVTRVAKVPKYVLLPVANTSALAIPEITLVPINTRLSISNAESDVDLTIANFSTGNDSPVIAD